MYLQTDLTHKCFTFLRVNFKFKWKKHEGIVIGMSWMIWSHFPSHTHSRRQEMLVYFFSSTNILRRIPFCLLLYPSLFFLIAIMHVCVKEFSLYWYVEDTLIFSASLSLYFVIVDCGGLLQLWASWYTLVTPCPELIKINSN